MSSDTEAPRLFACRHCASHNRIRPLVAEASYQTVTCGSCSKPFFFGELDYFAGLSGAAYEHPMDQEALRVLKRVPGVDSVLRVIIKEWDERQGRMQFMQSAIRVHEGHLRPLHEMLVYASKVLDISPVPDMYVMQTPVANAFAFGVEKPFLALTTGLLDLLDDEQQILGVIGHELGHIQAGHQLYRTAVNILVILGQWTIGKIVPAPVFQAISQALLYWQRCAELTCDRAAMLVQRDFQGFVRAQMKLTGGSRYTNGLLDPDAFLEQAKSSEDLQKEHILNRVFATIQENNRTHPFPVWRVKHAYEWVCTGNYLDILSGTYTKRGDEEAPPDDRNTPSSKSPPREVVDTLVESVRRFIKP